MKHGDFIVTTASLVDDSGIEIPANLVGELQESNSQLKVVVKYKGENCFISNYNPQDIVEVW